MTFTDDSTKAMLAKITAQNAAHRQEAYGQRHLANEHLDCAPAKAPKAGDGSKPPKKDNKTNSTKSKGKTKFNERNITRIPTSDGRESYRVQIRRRVNGKPHSICESFQYLKNAKKWRDKKLAEIELHGFPVETVNETTVADVIADRLEQGKALGKSALQNLQYVQAHEFGQTKVSTLTQRQLYGFGKLLLNGERTAQTVAGYMTHLASALKWAHRRGTRIPIEAVTLAMDNLWEDEILARSEERTRRAQLSELDMILTALSENRRQTIPVEILIVFAIYSARRLGEICRLRWEDLRETKSVIEVQEMKHPRKKKENHVWCKLPPEALAIIQAMPRKSEYIFPYSERSVGTAYRRHRDAVGITDLRFHDLRHEAISRQFEMGMPAAFVAKISGHRNGGCLYRYEHVEEIGDKFAGWPWLDRVLQACKELH